MESFLRAPACFAEALRDDPAQIGDTVPGGQDLVLRDPDARAMHVAVLVGDRDRLVHQGRKPRGRFGWAATCQDGE